MINLSDNITIKEMNESEISNTQILINKCKNLPNL